MKRIYNNSITNLKTGFVNKNSLEYLFIAKFKNLLDDYINDDLIKSLLLFMFGALCINEITFFILDFYMNSLNHISQPLIDPDLEEGFYYVDVSTEYAEDNPLILYFFHIFDRLLDVKFFYWLSGLIELIIIDPFFRIIDLYLYNEDDIFSIYIFSISIILIYICLQSYFMDIKIGIFHLNIPIFFCSLYICDYIVNYCLEQNPIYFFCLLTLLTSIFMLNYFKKTNKNYISNNLFNNEYIIFFLCIFSILIYSFSNDELLNFFIFFLNYIFISLYCFNMFDYNFDFTKKINDLNINNFIYGYFVILFGFLLGDLFLILVWIQPSYSFIYNSCFIQFILLFILAIYIYINNYNYINKKFDLNYIECIKYLLLFIVTLSLIILFFTICNLLTGQIFSI